MHRPLLIRQRSIVLALFLLALIPGAPAVDAALYGPELPTETHSPHHHATKDPSSPGQAHHCDIWSNPAFPMLRVLFLMAPVSLPVVPDHDSCLLSQCLSPVWRPPRSA